MLALSAPIDAIYFQVPWGSDELPPDLPPAREYWLVFRDDERRIPNAKSISQLVEAIPTLQKQAIERHWKIAGIQLDIDSSTQALPRYATFLQDLRKALKPGPQISITALLDWFRPGTAIGDVLQQVDEFVPQFYDVQDSSPYGRNLPIATQFTAAKWGPVFNRFRKPFRIGISTFGRARLLHPGSAPATIQDLRLLDVAVNRAFTLQTAETAAHELVLSYRNTSSGAALYAQPDDVVQFTLATPESIAAAVAQAKNMHGYCAGVIFFRWPAFNESLAIPPDEVLAAAGASTQKAAKSALLRTANGNCVAVACEDLYVLTSGPLSSKPTPYRIRSSVDLEYFVPGEKIPARLSGPAEIELGLPPYCGRTRLYLGRAVSLKRAQFAIEQEP